MCGHKLPTEGRRWPTSEIDARWGHRHQTPVDTGTLFAGLVGDSARVRSFLNALRLAVWIVEPIGFWNATKQQPVTITNKINSRACDRFASFISVLWCSDVQGRKGSGRSPAMPSSRVTD